MLSLTPLGKQLVHPGDSVLGALSRATVQADGTLSGQAGLSATYTKMVQDAFQNFLWDSPGFVAPGGFSQMEANFSLFWGLAIQLYEATLVSDQTPFDSFLADPAAVPSPLTAAAQQFDHVAESGSGELPRDHDQLVDDMDQTNPGVLAAREFDRFGEADGGGLTAVGRHENLVVHAAPPVIVIRVNRCRCRTPSRVCAPRAAPVPPHPRVARSVRTTRRSMPAGAASAQPRRRKSSMDRWWGGRRCSAHRTLTRSWG